MQNPCFPRAEARTPAYPATYQPELAPVWLHHAARLGGFACADPARPFSYLELGSGQGFSSLLHAACYPHATFHVVDRDTRAIDKLHALAAHLGNIGNLHAHALDLRSLPITLAGFDFIVAHGVYSWVDVNTRTTLRDLLAQRLVSDGLCYVSYNCMPGWSAEIPLRRLLLELDGHAPHREIAQLGYFRANPVAARAIAALDSRPAGYVAQEYLAPDWDALWSVDVIGDMERAGLDFAGSATLREFHPELLLDDAAHATVTALPTDRLRMLAIDFALNRSLRRDLFVRSDSHRRAAVDPRELVVGCASDSRCIADSILVPRGRVRFQADFIARVREIPERGPFALGDAARALSADDRETTVRNLLWLVAGGALTPALQVSNERSRLDRRTARAWLGAIAAGRIPEWVPSASLGSGMKLGREQANCLLNGTALSCDADQTRRLRARLAALGFAPIDP
jgi:hypothetical protein